MTNEAEDRELEFAAEARMEQPYQPVVIPAAVQRMLKRLRAKPYTPPVLPMNEMDKAVARQEAADAAMKGVA